MLEEEKVKLLKIALEAQRIGLCKHKSGNFSIRDEKTGYICITPTGIDRECLTIADISVVDKNLKLIEGLKPSSELLMHSEIYKVCNLAHSIVHTHSKMATSFSVVNKQIPAIIYELSAFRCSQGVIPVAPYGRPGTLELAKNVAKTAIESDLILMEKHGVVAIGETLDEAFLNAQYIEEIADIYYHALMINHGNEPDSFSVEELSGWEYPKL